MIDWFNCYLRIKRTLKIFHRKNFLKNLISFFVTWYSYKPVYIFVLIFLNQSCPFWICVMKFIVLIFCVTAMSCDASSGTRMMWCWKMTPSSLGRRWVISMWRAGSKVRTTCRVLISTTGRPRSKIKGN